MDRKEIKNSIDYIRIVDDLNNEALKFCIDRLYPFMNYQVLKKKDVRKVDLEEWLLKFNDKVPEYREKRERGSLNFFLYLLQLYLTESLKCVEGSKAEKYKNKALSIIDKVLYNDFVLDDIDDVVFIFIGLFRFHEKDISNSKNIPIKKEIQFTYFQEDAELLESIRDDGVYCEPREIVPSKNFIQFLKTAYYEERKAARDFMYINNILFLSRGLQRQGFFL